MRQPVLFIGHGSPMNALADNEYSKTLNELGQRLLKNPPKAILMISAHWETTLNTFFTADTKPKQIYDMSGFPDELYELKYQPPGYPQMFAQHPELEIKPLKDSWGLDHGTWSTLVHLFPKADIPVVQLSLDRNKSFTEHYRLAEKLSALRDEGILILGSGNIVHNLRNFDWKEKAPVMPWSADFDSWVHEQVKVRNDQKLIDEWVMHPSGKLAVPTPEHFLPLVYCLGASFENRSTQEVVFNEIQNGSISMRSYWFN
ncbi:4,5-DOPA dioxygenase extradiol [Bdellovibrio sp. qaytius]|nr:4,5-DOPA dioxygenase extradiol [Bdellovibrio sp. qaytius]